MAQYAFSCPGCDQSLEATDEHLGLIINCPVCSSPIALPDTEAEMLAICGVPAVEEVAPAPAPEPSLPQPHTPAPTLPPPPPSNIEPPAVSAPPLQSTPKIPTPQVPAAAAGFSPSLSAPAVTTHPHAAPVVTKHPQGSYLIYARGEDIDLDYSPNEEFPDEDSAKEEMAYIKQLLPEQPSAYQPSGKVGVTTLVLLPIAALASTVMGCSAPPSIS